VVAQEPESATVQHVRPGLRHRIDGRSRMVTVLRRQRARLHLELLHRVGEGQRQVQVVVRVVVVAAVEHV
jgi:hypothetical protein